MDRYARKSRKWSSAQGRNVKPVPFPMLNQDPKKEIPLTPAGSPVDSSERIFGLLATLLISVQRRLPMI